MIQLDSTEARKFAVHLEGYEGLGGELVKNGDFAEIGSDLVTNGDFSATGSELAVALTSWSTYTSGTSTVTYDGSAAELNIDALNSNVGIYQDNIFALGTSYKIVLSMKATAAFDVEIVESNSAATINAIGTVSLTTSYQDFTFYYVGTGTYDLFIHRLYSGSGASQTISIQTVSVKELGEGWTVSTTGSSTLQFNSNGAAFDVVGGDYVLCRQDYGFINGKSYKLVITFTGDGTSKKFSIKDDGGSLGGLNEDITISSLIPTTQTFYFTANSYSDTTLIKRLSGGEYSFSVSSISVKQLDPNGYWTLESGWTIGDNKAIADATDNLDMSQDCFSLNETYVVSINPSDLEVGGKFLVSDGAFTDLQTITSNGVQAVHLKTTTNTLLNIRGKGYSFNITDISARLKNTGAVTLTLINQLTEKETIVDLTPLLSNGRYTEFSYQPTGLIEGMYLIKFTGDSTTYAETLAYITTGTPPLGESEYKEYTTGDDNPDHVYIP